MCQLKETHNIKSSSSVTKISISVIVTINSSHHNGQDEDSGDGTKSVGNHFYPNDSVTETADENKKNSHIGMAPESESDPPMVFCEFCGLHNHLGLWRVPVADPSEKPRWMCEACYRTRRTPGTPADRWVWKASDVVVLWQDAKRQGPILPGLSRSGGIELKVKI